MLAAQPPTDPGKLACPRRRIAVSVAVVTLVVWAGCSERSTGGLDAIRERGEIRVAVRPGFSENTPESTDAGDQITLLRHLTARLGVEIEWLHPQRHDQLVEALETGLADLVVSRASPVSYLGTGVAATSPVEWVEDFLIAGSAMPELSTADLHGGKVYVQLSSLTPAVRQALDDLGLEVVAAPEDLSVEELVRQAADGEISATVADSGILDGSVDAQRLQLFGPLVGKRPVVWAVREGNLQLRRAIDDFLFAERVLTRGTPEQACRDLREVRQARVLRLVTRNSPTTCFVSRGGLEGFEYELAVAFAREQRLRLELAIPPPGVAPLDWLEQGYGDLAVLHEPLSPLQEGRFFVSEAYRRVDLVSVLSQRSEASIACEDLAGRTAMASRPVAEMLRLLPLEPVLQVVEAELDVDAFSAMKAVARGEVFAAVVDGDAADLELENGGGLQRGPVVVPDVDLVWVLNTSSPELRAAVDRFLRGARSSGLVDELLSKNLGEWTLYVSPRLPAVPEGDLTPFDEYLTWAARRNGLDWRLLASLMYEESRFDPDAVGPGGSAGLFQLMPFTWRELGVEDPHHPGEAIEAGATYLRWLMDRFPDLELPDQVAMAIASYNVGPKHVFDARRLASEMGLDPNRWVGNVETAMYILDDPEVARGYAAGVCRCRRGAAYTRRILRRYAAYAEQFPPA